MSLTCSTSTNALIINPILQVWLKKGQLFMIFITLCGISIFLIKLRFIIFRISLVKDNNTIRLSLEEYKLLEQGIKKTINIRQTKVLVSVLLGF